MGKTKFKEYLEKENIYFKENDGKIIITKDNDDVYLGLLTSMPKGIVFNNDGEVYLTSLTSMPEGIEFNNGSDLYLSSLTSMPEGIKFNNGGDVDLSSLTFMPEGIVFNNGGYVNLDSLTSLPEGIEFNNGGTVYLSSLTPEGFAFNNGGEVYLKNEILRINTPYIKRFKVEKKRNKVYLYKRVSHDFKTQEGTKNETLWEVGTIVEHPNWNPTENECGEGKFHACAFPHWCSAFRSGKNDKFIKIEIDVKDLYEWTESPIFPEKISFRKGKVIKIVKP